MHIEYYKNNGVEYARLRDSVRKGSGVKHNKSTTLGRVLDRNRLIFKSREHGVYQYDEKADKRLPVPGDFCGEVIRSNAKEQLIVDFGNVYYIDCYIKQLGLRPVFDAIGYGNQDSFMALLNYYILESGSNAHALDWYSGSYARIVYPTARLESSRISDMLRALGSETVQRKFFNAYVSYLKKETPEERKGYILIDSTGLPNDIRLPITAVSNHNGDISNEVRLIYVVQRGTGMPIYMRYIPGNIVDVSTLVTTIAELKALKVDTKFAILDAGYLSIDSIKLLLEHKISFLARVKKNWKFYKEILGSYRKELESTENIHVFHERFVYLKRVEYKIEDKHTIYCYLGLDDERRNTERRQLAKTAEEEELKPDDIKQRFENMGVFMLVSSRKIATKDLLPLYYSREDIEQVFDISKSYAKALPLCVQTVETFRGHLLMVFCSTIILRLLQQKLVSTHYSLDDFLYAMRNQKAKVFDDVVIPTERTKKQNDFYKLLGITPKVRIPRKETGK